MSWVVSRLLFGDTDVTRLVVDWGEFRESVSDSWEIEDPTVTIALVDWDQEWFDTIRDATTRIAAYLYDEEGEVIFTGLIDPVRADWDSGDKLLKLSIPSIFSEAKTKVVTPEFWQRPPATYVISQASNVEGDKVAELVFESVADLYPGDEIFFTHEDEENNSVEEITRVVRAVLPEYGRVLLIDSVGVAPVVGDTWFRKNHELRYVYLPTAISILNRDLASMQPEPLEIDAEIEDVEFESYATAPFPVPRRDNEACSVYLQCRYDTDRVAGIYCDSELVLFGLEGDPTFISWDNTGANAADWPFDWARDRETAPAELLNPPFLHPFPEDGVRSRTRARDGDTGETSPLPILKHTVVDYNNLVAFMLERGDDASWRMFRIPRFGSNGWGGEVELFSVTSGDGVIYAGLGLDHVTGELYSVRKNNTNAQLVKWDEGGGRDDY